jgi:hypothetical protein
VNETEMTVAAVETDHCRGLLLRVADAAAEDGR